MADSYEELVELGFEGVDRFATHFHDPVFGYVSKHKPHSKGKHDSEAHSEQRQRKLPKEEVPAPRRDSPQQQESYQERDLPPHPQWNLPPPPPGPPPGPPPTTSFNPGQLPPPGQAQRRQLPRQRSYSEPRGDPYDSKSLPDSTYDSDSHSDDESLPRAMYSPNASDRRRSGGWREDDRYERTVEEREYYRPNGGVSEQVVVRSRDANRYQGAPVPRAPSPPPDMRYDARVYNDNWAVRQRPLPQRQRSSSWSPQRRSDRRYESPSRRRRSKSPSQYRGLAAVVGALVGGAAGSQVKKNQSGANTIATVGGAIIGGIAARELEQQYDRRREREEQRAYKRGEGREKRRLEREYNYD